MDMDVEDGLSRRRPGIHSDIEAGDRRVCRHQLDPPLVQKSLDRVSFGLMQVRVVGRMTDKQ